MVAKIEHSQFVPVRHYWFELSEIFSPTEYVHNSWKLSCKANWGLLFCLLVRFYVIGILLSYIFCTLFTVVSCYHHVVYIWEWSWLLIYFMSIGSQRGIVANLYCKLSNMGREGTVPGMWSIFHPISCWANIICSIPTYYKQVFHCSLFLTLKKKFLTKLQYFVVVIILVVGISRPTPAKKKMICMFLFFDRIYTIRNTQVAATEVKSNGSERHATKAGQFTRFSEWEYIHGSSQACYSILRDAVSIGGD